MLWFQPARDWIDGKAPRVVPAAPRAAAAPGGDAARRPAGRPERAARLPRLRRAAGRPARLRRPRPDPRSTSARRPARLVLLRWCGPARWPGRAPRSVFVVMLVSVAVLLAAPDMLIDELNRQNPELREDGMTSETLRRRCSTRARLLVVWSVVAVGPRGVRLARPALGVEGLAGLRVQRHGALPARRDRQPGDARPAGGCAGSPSRCCCGPRCGRSCAAAADRSLNGVVALRAPRRPPTLACRSPGCRPVARGYGCSPTADSAADPRGTL